MRGWAARAFQHLINALSSKDPRIECRKLLVQWTLLDSDYTAMMIPPPTEPDWTGLRGLQGISGELWKYKVELGRRYEPIKDMLHAISAEVSEENVRDVVFVLATQASYLVNMANTARIAIDDYHHDLNLDWFRPMKYSFLRILGKQTADLTGKMWR